MLRSVIAGLVMLLPLHGGGPTPHGPQPGVFGFRTYGVEDGLGNLAVYEVAQDGEGYLWVATDDGPYRYDGHAFRKMGRGLRPGTVWQISTGPGLGVWVNMDDGLFELKGGAFEAVAGLPPVQGGFLAQGPGGAAAAGVGRTFYARKGPGPMAPVREFPGPVTGGCASRDFRTIYVTTDETLWRLEGGNWTSRELPKGLHGTGTHLFKDRTHRLFLRNRHALWRLDSWDAAFKDLSRHLPGNAFNAYAPAEDGLGRIWVGTSKGLTCFDGDTAWVLGEDKGLPGGWAGPVLVDREGSLWVGSEGVHRLKGRFLWTNFGTHQGLPSPNVWDIGRSRDGRVFACTDHGVAVLDGERWSVLPGTEGATLLAGGGDGLEALWFAGTDRKEAWNSVLRLELKTGQTRKILAQGIKPSDMIQALASDGQGGVYLGTVNSGVHHMIRSGSGWRTEALPFPGAASGERVNVLRRLKEGGVMAATAHGLYILEGKAWKRMGTRDGLLGENCMCIGRDPKGSLWVAFSDARGINRVAHTPGGWVVAETMTLPEALFRDTVMSMVFDASSVLWLGTGGGMKRWDGRNLEIFGRGDGLLSQDANANAITADLDGSVWQGFSNGISCFSPWAFKGQPEPPVTRITEVVASKTPLPLLGPPKVPYRDNTVEIRFGALSFLNESRVVQEVRLLGLEGEWRTASSRGLDRFTALAPGEYRFEVRSRIDEGPPGPSASYAFRILPPWWGTWWFRALAVLGAAGAVVLGFRRRTANLYRRNEMLEAMVAARTRDLEKANRALEEASLVDPLTGLHNRRFLDLSLPVDARQAQRTYREILDAGGLPDSAREDVLLFLLDLDHFKRVNDTYGHLAGDQVLKQLAEALKAMTRSTDYLVRWGGEEFLLVARRSRRQGQTILAQGLLEGIKTRTFTLPDGVELKLTCSIGFTALPIHPRAPEVGDWQQALRMADQCLYAAKNTGRCRWVGVSMLEDADPAKLDGLKSWDVRWAVDQGLMKIETIDPDFRWTD